MGECTIAVFSGRVTSDGRPLLWKNRDVPDHNQRFIYFRDQDRNGVTTYPFIGNVYQADSTKVWMGVNGVGFAIINSDSYNLNDSLLSGLGDGALMKIALETCTDLVDFEMLLDSTNNTGRSGCWNFGVLDATEDCALYECGNNSWEKYDPDDPDYGAPGYLVRANFSISGRQSYQAGFDRYKRASDLVNSRLDQGSIDVGYVLSDISRDLANSFGCPYPLPYHGSQFDGPSGYIYNYGSSIANLSTSSAVVIRGTREGEDPALATTFAILGFPALSVALPLWVKSGAVPYFLARPDTAPVYTLCMQRRPQLYDNPDNIFLLNTRYLLNDDGQGVYSYTLPIEAWAIGRANGFLEGWHIQPPTTDVVRDVQFRIAYAAFTGFINENADVAEIFDNSEEILPSKLLLYNYPNPFNSGTNIIYDGPGGCWPYVLNIYDSLGRLVQVVSGTDNGPHNVSWTGMDMFGNRVASGIYLYTLQCGPYNASNKMTLLK